MKFCPQKISFEEAKKDGIKINFDQMENGEKRYRLVGSDGSGYCRTLGSNKGAWQNSHYHKAATEIYIVQSGWIVYGEIDLNRNCKLNYLKEGESVTVSPLVHHNVFMSSNSVVHTIKCGKTDSTADWFPSYELDNYTKSFSEADLGKLFVKK
ncbi:cupin domain-containing protein [Metabacillus sp. JX24]|uniref:cupin domain-containing protein n=1 Tax=Metabacillus sp. JX24 TaxID=3240759 RepID=UPI00350EDF8D